MRFNLAVFRDIKNLAKSEKKLIISSAVALSALLILFFAVYLPIKNKVKMFAKEQFQVDSQIKEIQELVDTTAGKGFARLEERFKALDRKFPQEEKEAIILLSAFAQRLNIDIITMRPQSKKDFIDEKENKVVIDGKTCRMVGVSLEMRALYEDLVEYIRILRQMLPSYVSIDNLKIIKDRTDSPVLHIRLNFNLHLLS
ncbi:MAG: hypothetical protein JSW17_03210 [Candidatus Omnitrophota bacterium]|nr:MAG: hypothetical protein JSW17_03210 [Candidatus Omnitrophota bacterium]